MHQLLLELKKRFEFTNNVFIDGIRLLNEYDKHIVAEHSQRVATKAEELAVIFGENSEAAKLSGVMHDISAVIPNENKIAVAESLNIDILLEEREFPLIIHQKLSRKIAEVTFGVTDKQILNAIGCHTTLKANPTRIEMILFIADKLEWDQGGTPPYLSIVQEGLKESLEHGVFAFINYLFDNKSKLKVLHPWLVDAYDHLSKSIKSKQNIT